MSKPQPYVGIAGLGSSDEYKAIASYAEEVLCDTNCFLMLSILASGQTQLLDTVSPFGHAWYPVGEAIRDGVPATTSPIIRTFVHLDSALLHNHTRLLNRTGSYIAGVQMNLLDLHDPQTIRAINHFRQKHPQLLIILQAHRTVLGTHTAAQLVSLIKDLPIDYLLLDASQGEGLAMSMVQLRPFIDALYSSLSSVNVVVAGGLEAATLPDLFAPLLSLYPDLSCDAESRLRHGPAGNTTLDLKAIKKYLDTWKTTYVNSLRHTEAA